MQWWRQHWLQVIAIVLLCGALGNFPYVYYQVMNWVVVGASLMTAWEAKKQKKEIFLWVFIAVAVVFNPVAPLYLRPDVWQAADVLAALLFVAAFFLMRPRENH